MLSGRPLGRGKVVLNFSVRLTAQDSMRLSFDLCNRCHIKTEAILNEP